MRGLFDPIMEALPSLGTLAVLLVGAGRVADGATDAGDLVSIAYLFTLLALPDPGHRLGARRPAPRAGRLRPGAPRCSRRPARRPYGPDAAPGGDRRRATSALAGVDFAFDGTDRPTLHRRHLRRAGRHHRRRRRAHRLGQVDARRACWSGWSTRTTAHVLLDGVDLRRLREGEVSDQAAFVAQGTFLFDDTVRGNVTLGGAFADDEVWTALRVAAADDFVAAPARRARHPGRRARRHACPAASGSGWRWPGRWSAARGCWCSTTPPAPSTRRSRRASSTRCAPAERPPATVVVVAYRQATIALADEVVWLEHGRVLARGTHEELLAAVPGLRRPGPRLLARRRWPRDRRRARASAGPRARSPRCAAGLRLMPEFRRGLPVTLPSR